MANFKTIPPIHHTFTAMISTNFLSTISRLSRYIWLLLSFGMPSLTLLCAAIDEQRSLAAFKTSAAPKIDGLLDEPVWQQAPVADQFITYAPTVGDSSAQAATIRVIYDDEAIYVGAYLYDTQPDSIMRQLGLRDSYGDLNADWIAAEFDTYNDDQNAFGFSVTASGVQSDWRNSIDNEDNSWNAVWQSAVKLQTRVGLPKCAFRTRHCASPTNPTKLGGLVLCVRYAACEN
ncbi:MAG: carbohydrate binding family 9 domain-containing protein [Sphingobacteriales bacterium]|nr:carbohydrate binding family 9 domain-containing protein [Sphingobacteriales bacterium]